MRIKLLVKILLLLLFFALPVPAVNAGEIYNLNQFKNFDYENIWQKSRGANVNVCVVDTGISNLGMNHPKVTAGFSVDSVNGTLDLIGHGSAIAAVIASPISEFSSNAGLAPESNIIPIKVADEFGVVTAYNTAKGLSWGLTHGCDIVNLSLTGEQDYQPLREVILALLSKNIPVVASAGNRYQNNNPLPFPAAIPGVFAVTAIDNQNQLTEYASRGNYVSFVEYGNNILAPNLDKGLYSWSGSSFATAIVTGKLALIKSLYPNISINELITVLENTSTDLGATGKDIDYGYGVINVDKALIQLESKYIRREDIFLDNKNNNLLISFSKIINKSDIKSATVNGIESTIVIKKNTIHIEKITKGEVVIEFNNPYLENIKVNLKPKDYYKIETEENTVKLSNLPKKNIVKVYKNNRIGNYPCKYSCTIAIKGASSIRIINSYGSTGYNLK